MITCFVASSVLHPAAVRPYRAGCGADSRSAGGIGSVNRGVVRGADAEGVCGGTRGMRE
jgi:hypothetical protein